MDCVAATSPERKHSKALVIEDVRIATAELRHRGYVCDRITHVELMSFIGSQYLGNLLAGDYHLLWVATPSDWTTHTWEEGWATLSTYSESYGQGTCVTYTNHLNGTPKLLLEVSSHQRYD